MVVAAEQYASRLVVPSSQQRPSLSWSSHNDIAIKTLQKLAAPHLAPTLKALEKAVAKAKREHDEARAALFAAGRARQAAYASTEVEDLGDEEGHVDDDEDGIYYEDNPEFYDGDPGLIDEPAVAAPASPTPAAEVVIVPASGRAAPAAPEPPTAVPAASAAPPMPVAATTPEPAGVVALGASPPAPEELGAAPTAVANGTETADVVDASAEIDF